MSDPHVRASPGNQSARGPSNEERGIRRLAPTAAWKGLVLLAALWGLGCRAERPAVRWTVARLDDTVAWQPCDADAGLCRGRVPGRSPLDLQFRENLGRRLRALDSMRGAPGSLVAAAPGDGTAPDGSTPDEAIAIELTLGLDGRPEALARAVDAGLRLRDRGPLSRGTCFNVVLAAQRLGLRSLAEAQRRECSRMEPDAAWRGEMEAMRLRPAEQMSDREPYRSQFRLASGALGSDREGWMAFCSSADIAVSEVPPRKTDRWAENVCRSVEEDASGMRRRLDAFAAGLEAYGARDYADADKAFAVAASAEVEEGDALTLLALAHRGAALYGLGREDAALLQAVAGRARVEGYGWASGLARWTLGRIAVADGRWLDAIELFDGARRDFEGIGARGLAASVEVLRGEARSVIGDVHAAWTSSSAALRESYGSNEPERIFFVNNILADMAFRLDLRRLALEFQEEAIHHSAGQHPRVLANCELWKAHLLAMLGFAEVAEGAMSRAERTAERLVASYDRDLLQGEIAFARASLARREAALPALDRAIDLLSRQRQTGLLLPALHRRARVARISGNPDLALADLKRALELELGFAGALQADETTRLAFVGTRQSVADELIGLELEVQRPWAALATAQRVLATAAPGRIRSERGPEEVSRSLRSSPDLAVVVLAQLDDSAVAWLVTADSMDVVTWESDRMELRGALARYWLAADGAESVRHASALYEMVVRPWRDRLPGISRLFVVPDRELASVPIAGLYDSRRGEFLIESLVLQFGATFSAPAPGPKASAAARFVVFAPDAEVAAERFGLPELPAAVSEANVVAERLPGATSIRGAAASREALLRSLSEATVFHFVGHAIPFARGGESALVVSSSSLDDALVTSSDLAALRLERTQLITLSGCSTAGGRSASWQAGWGLARAALSARAPAVLTTIAEVVDAEARDLMVDFYGELSDSPASALATAQRHAIRAWRAAGSKRRPSWPAFVLLSQ